MVERADRCGCAGRSNEPIEPIWRGWPAPSSRAMTAGCAATRARTGSRLGEPGRAALRREGISKHFGGISRARRRLARAAPGEMHGLIGPNGSGKTTLLNLLSGYYQPDAARSGWTARICRPRPVQQRARLGIARTFQKPRLLRHADRARQRHARRLAHARAGFLATAFALPRRGARSAPCASRADGAAARRRPRPRPATAGPTCSSMPSSASSRSPAAWRCGRDSSCSTNRPAA